ncbi:sigma-70 family RNA polymerase sigma factor [Ilumatobacter sp.]|uniref:sigma-70 family RNA polymerase sigma factor n=1 Tax=Ilumatobacter sp. TaxID=1967498 RepID=UPI003AF98D6C
MSFEPADLVDHLDALHRYALGMTRDPDLADDLVHDVVVRAIERRDQYRHDAPLRHWLMRMLHNLTVDRARRSQRELLVDEVEERWHDDHYTVESDAVIARASSREELQDALARLPFAARAAVLLHDVEQYRVIEIAELQQISLPAAKQRLRRGRMALVTALAEGEARRTLTKGVPMRCWDARQHVSDYMNGDLDAEIAAGVEAHLAACPTCPPLYAALVGVSDQLGTLRDPDSVINPSVADHLRSLLQPGPSGR